MRRWNASRASLGIETVGKWLAQGVNATTRARPRFEKRHIMSNLSQPQGRRQPSDAGARMMTLRPDVERRSSAASKGRKASPPPATLASWTNCRRVTKPDIRTLGGSCRGQRYSKADKPEPASLPLATGLTATGLRQQVDAVDNRARICCCSRSRASCRFATCCRRPVASGAEPVRCSHRAGRRLLHVSVSTFSPL